MAKIIILFKNFISLLAKIYHRIFFFVALLVCIFITFAIYWKIPIQGKIPFPGDLLVGRFFPFNTIDWLGYPLGVPYKEFINADVIRQLFPWRELAMEQFKSGQIPWWNPYTFSGTPLLANIQTAAFYPLNFLYFIFSSHSSWIIGVMLQPILSMLFMWLYVSELGFKKMPGLLTAVIFAFSGFMMVWWEFNTIGHAALWLPLSLWAIERLKLSHKINYIFIFIISVSSTLLAGHIQTGVYSILLVLFYALFRSDVFRNRKNGLKLLMPVITSVILAVLISFIQYLPSAFLLPHTPRAIQSDSHIYYSFIIPWENLLTFIAPDYFGNPATANYWGHDYGEFQLFFGSVALIFFLLGLAGNKHPIKYFYNYIFFISLAFSLSTGLPQLLHVIKLPLLSNSAPSRIIYLIHFSASIIAGFGINEWLQHQHNNNKLILKLLLLVISAIWIFTASNFLLSGNEVERAQLLVSLRNLVIPTIVTFVGLIIVFLYDIRINRFQVNVNKFLPVLILPILILEYSYFANKYQTFSNREFFFPDNVLFNKIREESNSQPYRFFGDYTASVGSNIWLPYKVYGAEGYDALYLRRYGELVEAAKTGNLPFSLPRSDANLEPNSDNFNRRRIQDLLGVKFIIEKTDFPSGDWKSDANKFPEDRYQFFWRERKFIIYENTSVLSRAFLVGEIELRQDDRDILATLFSPDFDPRNKIIIEEDISTEITPASGNVSFKQYLPSLVELKVVTDSRQLLFLSDTYYPDWQAAVDGIATKIYRANYAFRAVIVEPGEHTVIFYYQPSWLPKFQ